MALAWVSEGDPPIAMKAFIRNSICTALATLFLGAGSVALAHPGPPGHYHPDEVDEFDQVVTVAPESADNRRGYDIGGIVALCIIGGCLGYALLQRDGGIWRDVTIHH